MLNQHEVPGFVGVPEACKIRSEGSEVVELEGESVARFTKLSFLLVSLQDASTSCAAQAKSCRHAATVPWRIAFVPKVQLLNESNLLQSYASRCTSLPPVSILCSESMQTTQPS